MKKKISLPIVITVALLAAAIAFSAAFIIARASFNSELHQLSEKQALFGNLADIDRWVRENYSGTINEETLIRELCKAYADAIGGDVLYVKAEDFDEAKYKKGENCAVYPLSNGDTMVILKN